MSNGRCQELFDIVDEYDNVVGQASRQEVHDNLCLIHRVVHVLVFNTKGELFLQKRSLGKDMYPGKWDTSVGGHVNAGESYEFAAIREMKEELGIQGAEIEFLYTFLHSNSHESEFVQTYRCCWGEAIIPDREEIEEGRFWSLQEIDGSDSSLFSPTFLDELKRLGHLPRRPKLEV